jgi:regulator of replication initiation timing
LHGWEAWVAELVAKNRQLEIANAGLRRRLDDIEDEADE